jgi:ADP-heptose:LPS heptosyltransferase
LSVKTGLHVLVTWGPGEEALARETVDRAGSAALLAPSTPRVGALASLIRLCGAFVCNYSGPMNVAMAVETPLVALGSTSPDDWGPFGEMHRTINKSGERDSYTEEEQLAMMKQIKVDEVEEMVLRRMRELYGEKNKGQ